MFMQGPCDKAVGFCTNYKSMCFTLLLLLMFVHYNLFWINWRHWTVWLTGVFSVGQFTKALSIWVNKLKTFTKQNKIWYIDVMYEHRKALQCNTKICEKMWFVTTYPNVIIIKKMYKTKFWNYLVVYGY